MDINNVKQNAALSGNYDNMNWYYLEGDLYIEVNGPLDILNSAGALFK